MAHDADLRLNQETQIPEPDPAVTPAAPATTAPGRFKLRPPSRRWLYWAVGLGVVGLAVWALRPGPKRVDLITVEPGPLAVTVDAEGRTRVRDRFVIAAPVDGRLSRMGLEVGDPVTANQVVARLDPLPLTTEVQQAQARLAELRAQTRGVDTLRPKTDALEQAQNRIAAAQADQSRAEAELARAAASWQQAQRELERANELAAQGAISAQAQESAALAATSQEQAWKAAQQQVDSAIAAVNAAQNDRQILQAEQQDPDYLLDVYQAEIASTEATLARLADAARRTTITAPSAGQVLRILEESARYVTAGTPLLEVGDPEQLEIVIDVLSSDAVKIQPGDRIHINQWGGDETLLAAVSYLEPAAFTKVSALGVEEQRVNVIATFTDAVVPLGDGYRVDTQIVVDENPEALTVPISALFPCDAGTSGTCVFQVERHRAQITPVAVGLRNTFDAEVVAGLETGDTVIAYPESVESGDRVQPR
jgi:HlyD family secretion protein